MAASDDDAALPHMPTILMDSTFETVAVAQNRGGGRGARRRRGGRGASRSAAPRSDQTAAADLFGVSSIRSYFASDSTCGAAAAPRSRRAAPAAVGRPTGLGGGPTSAIASSLFARFSVAAPSPRPPAAPKRATASASVSAARPPTPSVSPPRGGRRCAVGHGSSSRSAATASAIATALAESRCNVTLRNYQNVVRILDGLRYQFPLLGYELFTESFRRTMSDTVGPIRRDDAAVRMSGGASLVLGRLDAEDDVHCSSSPSSSRFDDRDVADRAGDCHRRRDHSPDDPTADDHDARRYVPGYVRLFVTEAHVLAIRNMLCGVPFADLVDRFLLPQYGSACGIYDQIKLSALLTSSTNSGNRRRDGGLSSMLSLSAALKTLDGLLCRDYHARCACAATDDGSASMDWDDEAVGGAAGAIPLDELAHDLSPYFAEEFGGDGRRGSSGPVGGGVTRGGAVDKRGDGVAVPPSGTVVGGGGGSASSRTSVASILAGLQRCVQAIGRKHAAYVCDLFGGSGGGSFGGDCVRPDATPSSSSSSFSPASSTSSSSSRSCGCSGVAFKLFLVHDEDSLWGALAEQNRVVSGMYWSSAHPAVLVNVAALLCGTISAQDFAGGFVLPHLSPDSVPYGDLAVGIHRTLNVHRTMFYKRVYCLHAWIFFVVNWLRDKQYGLHEALCVRARDAAGGPRSDGVANYGSRAAGGRGGANCSAGSRSGPPPSRLVQLVVPRDLEFLLSFASTRVDTLPWALLRARGDVVLQYV